MLDQDQHKLFTRRSLILNGVQASLGLCLIGRLYYLQIIQGKHFQLLSDKNRIHSLFLMPARGRILDRTGHILADMQNSYTAIITPEDIDDHEKLISSLKKFITLRNSEWLQISSQLKQKRKYFSVILKENLTWEELAKLELHTPDLPGISIEKGQSRFYPYPELTCHFIGYVAPASEKDLINLENSNIAGTKIGKSGIEQTYDARLRGQPGIKHVEINALRQAIRTLDIHPSVPGKDFELTLDFQLQKESYETLQKVESAAAIVLDTKTGAILSYVSHPSFNTNLFSNNALSKADWKSLSQNIYKPLTNKVIAGQYAPGSIFKMVVALTALNAGIIDEKTSFHCPGHFDYHGHIFHCWRWKNGGHGHVTLQSAIASSCDVFFYQIATRLDVDDIAETAGMFGLGQLTGLEIFGEKRGLIPTRKWKKTIRKQSWSGGETINLSIGQGSVLATPIQLAKMVAQFVNGGLNIRPHFIKGNEHNNPTPLPFKESFFEIIKDGMIDAINEPWGTSYASRLDEPYSFGGKTGSTQVSRITKEERDQGTLNQRPYHLREHALFCGFAPIENPRFATCVVVEHGGSGGRVAAPLGKEILLAAQKLIKA